MSRFANLLKGNDLRSIGNSNKIVAVIKDQKQFDELFINLFAEDRTVVMRAADAIEKISVKNPPYLQPHKKEILNFFSGAENKELQWHLALIAPRVSWNANECKRLFNVLKAWATNKSLSRIVRVNSIQALHDFFQQGKFSEGDFKQIISEIEKENIPSINARIRKLKD